MGSPKVYGDTIESLINERRETEKEARRLQKEIERIGLEKAELLGGIDERGGAAAPMQSDTGTMAALDEEIDRLTQLKKEKTRKLTEICRVVRTISAGD